MHFCHFEFYEGEIEFSNQFFHDFLLLISPAFQLFIYSSYFSVLLITIFNILSFFTVNCLIIFSCMISTNFIFAFLFYSFIVLLFSCLSKYRVNFIFLFKITSFYFFFFLIFYYLHFSY